LPWIQAKLAAAQKQIDDMTTRLSEAKAGRKTKPLIPRPRGSKYYSLAIAMQMAPAYPKKFAKYKAIQVWTNALLSWQNAALNTYPPLRMQSTTYSGPARLTLSLSGGM